MEEGQDQGQEACEGGSFSVYMRGQRVLDVSGVNDEKEKWVEFSNI